MVKMMKGMPTPLDNEFRLNRPPGGCKAAGALSDEITDDTLVPAHIVLAITASRAAWVAATKANHPPLAKWTAKDRDDAKKAWAAWFDKEGCKRKY